MAEHIERNPLSEQMGQGQQEVLTEVRKGAQEIEMPPEVKRWMDLRREEVRQPQTTPKAVQNTAVLTPAAPATPKIIIPGNKTNFSAGFKKAFDDAGRWFSTFWFRVIKMKKGTIEFKEEDV